MKTYNDSTKLEILDPDLESGFIYDGYIVTGTEKVIMEDSVTELVPNGLRIEREIKEPCKYYHAYTKEEIDAKREEKLSEISNDCNSSIVAGTEVELSNKEKKHFAYSIEDQSNVSEMFNAVIMGAEAYPYHADNEPCMMYSAADIVLIYVALSSLKTSQTTYHNMLKQYIKTLEKYSDIEAVKYGQPLSGEYLSTYETLMSSAQTEMQKILAKVDSYVS